MTTYNTIGHNYNTTRRADPFIAQTLYDILQPQPNGQYLDIGCGTGNYTVALANMGVTMHGVEPSEVMLNEARAKSTQVQWHHGNAENIPFADNFFDGAIATLTLNHWDSLDKGFAEVYRVLKPQGKIVVFAAISDLTKHFWLRHYFPQMIAAAMIKENTFDSIEKAAISAGFTIAATQPYLIQDDLQDSFMYVGKNNPRLYFDPAIRSGISAFASLSNKEEVEKGLAQLEKDINSGQFETIKIAHPSVGGDYLFIEIVK